MTGDDILSFILKALGTLVPLAIVVIKMIAAMLERQQIQRHQDQMKIEQLRDQLTTQSITALKETVEKMALKFDYMQEVTIKKFEVFTDQVNALKIALNQNAFEIRSAKESLDLGLKHWAGELERILKASSVKQIAPDVFRVESKAKEGK